MMATLTSGKHTFEIADDFPEDYIVWPIGRMNFRHPKYIPLGKPTDGCHIDTQNLKALNVGNESLALEILKQASWNGVDYKKYAENYAQR